MSGFPSTEEILGQIETEEPAPEHQAMEADPNEAPKDAGDQVNDTPFLDFEKHKNHHISYNANGKDVSESLEQLIRKAQMGHDYGQKMADLKQNYIARSELESGYVPKSEYDSLVQWKKFDDYARQNPKWAEHVQKQYDQRDIISNENYDPNDPNVQLLSQLQQRLDERLGQYDQRFEAVDSFIRERQEKAEDKALEDQVNATMEKFNFMKIDDSVQLRVLDHMQQNGIGNFQSAFVDLYQEELLNQANSHALEKAAKDRQKQVKQGVLGVSESPPQRKPQASSRPRSDQDAYKQALDYLEQQA